MRYTLLSLFLLTTGCGGVVGDTGSTSEANSAPCGYDYVTFPGSGLSVTRTATAPNCYGKYDLEIANTLNAKGRITVSGYNGPQGTCSNFLSASLYGWNGSQWESVGQSWELTNYQPGLPCPSGTIDLTQPGAFAPPGAKAPNAYNSLLLTASSIGAGVTTWGDVTATVSNTASLVWWGGGFHL